MSVIKHIDVNEFLPTTETAATTPTYAAETLQHVSDGEINLADENAAKPEIEIPAELLNEVGGEDESESEPDESAEVADDDAEELEVESEPETGADDVVYLHEIIGSEWIVELLDAGAPYGMVALAKMIADVKLKNKQFKLTAQEKKLFEKTLRAMFKKSKKKINPYFALPIEIVTIYGAKMAGAISEAKDLELAKRESDDLKSENDTLRELLAIQNDAMQRHNIQQGGITIDLTPGNNPAEPKAPRKMPSRDANGHFIPSGSSKGKSTRKPGETRGRKKKID